MGKKKLTMERYLDAAKAHGDESGSEYEIGDLELYFMTAYGLLTSEQKKAFDENTGVKETLAMGEGIF